ncbi:MAG: MarR family transcriptional regulator [Reyranellaceae bacterium]
MSHDGALPLRRQLRRRLLTQSEGRLTSGAVTGLIDRLERLELVERVTVPGDRRKVRVQVRPDRIAPIGALYAPLEKSIQALLSGFGRDEPKVLLDFSERSGDLLHRRVAELNSGK